MSIQQLAAAEVATINRTFAEFGVLARVAPQRGTLIANSSHLAHRLERGKGITTNDVERRMPEIRQALARLRNDDRLPVRFDWPLIETPHPSPVPLRWTADTLQSVAPHHMLIGRAYSSRHEISDEAVSFDESTHILIAGITNAGKSVLAQTMLLSLANNTSPADLQIVIVDLKNEDMTPFQSLPHVARFARRPVEAVEAIKAVQLEKERRIDNPNRKPFRLVLWIDEIAQLAGDKETIEMLGDIASIGRSKSINLVVATQHPTAQGGIGGLMKANFPLRLVGMVAPGTAHIATNRPGTGAEMLPGKGSFLYLQSNDVHRFQSFYVAPSDIKRQVDAINRRWTGTQAETHIYQSTHPVPDVVYQSVPTEDDDCTTDALPFQPLDKYGERVVRELYRQHGSMNAVIRIVWPNRRKQRCIEYLKPVIERMNT